MVHKLAPPPKISVIIPVYNCEKYLREAIESVLNQTFKDFELIVIDDGSTDNTKEIIEDYDLTAVFKLNGGTASALNAGIRHSRGEWIKWLSADDVLYPDALQNLICNVYDKNVIYFTDYDIINENGEIIGEFLEQDRDMDQQRKDIKNYFFGNGSTSLIHKSVFEKCGMFDDSLKHSEDYDFWMRCSLKFNVELRAIPIKTIKYRRHPEQLTNKVGGSLDMEIKSRYA